MKTASHTTYRVDGKKVPGTTTVLSILAKPGLIHWAWKLGKEGQDWRKYRDDKAEIGSLAHYLILCHFREEKPELGDYTQNQIETANECLDKFFSWEGHHDINPILVEEGLTSGTHHYGGTIDLFCMLDGKAALVDFKTGKGIYSSFRYQLAAYYELLSENSYDPEECRILRIGRDPSEGFEEAVYADLRKEFELFKHCLAIYNLQGEMK